MNDLGLEDNIQESENTFHQSLAEQVGEDGRRSISRKPSKSYTKTMKQEGEEHTDHYASEKGIHNPERHWRLHMQSLSNGEDLKEEDKKESGIYQPTLWWMTSTAFPLFAGTFGPIANLFSVCALVQTWRAHIEDGMRIPDPHWLTGLNATSLLLALAANLVLMFNFARRIRYALAQPITITLWYISSILLFICIGLVNEKNLVLHHDPSTTTYTQSYYYGLISSILYFAVASLLLVSSLGSLVFHAYPPSFATLTGPQRTLMLQTTSFSLYLALGAGVFSEIEGWQFVDGVYWADYTLLTIGLGTDFPLHRVLARVLLIPYAAFGITLIGLIVSSVRGLVLERAKAKVVRRHLGQQREKWRQNIEKRARLAANKRSTESIVDDSNGHLGFWSHVNYLRRREEKKLMQMPHKLTKHATIPLKYEDQLGTWHRAEFELMRLIEKSSERSERYNALFVSFFVILIVWIGGSLVFWSCERNGQGWSYIDSFYFSYNTLLTIGYGDFYPSSSAGKPFFVVWSLIAVPAMTILISDMGDTVVKGVQEVTVRVSQWTILPERASTSVHSHKNISGPVIQGKKPKRGPSTDGDGDGAAESQHSTTSSYAVSQRRGAQSPGSSRSPHRRMSTEGQPGSALEAGVELLGNKIGDFEKSEDRGSSLAARLVREISKVAKDLRQKPPKRYSWEEWSVWLDMLGEREGDGADHHSARSRESDQPRSAPILFAPHRADTLQFTTEKAEAEEVEHRDSTSDSHSMRDLNPRSRQSPDQHNTTHASVHNSGQDAASQRDRPESTKNSDWKWTWLDDQGPLLSPLTETEWLIRKLCFRLEEVLEDEIREAHAASASNVARQGTASK